MIRRYAIFMVFLFGIFSQESVAQDPKPPEIINDYLTTIYGSSESVYVLANDISENGHPIMISFSQPGYYFEATRNDSVIFLHSKMTLYPNQFPVYDSIKYVILDTVNSMVSDPGYLIVTIHDFDFDLARTNLELNNYSAPFTAIGNYFTHFFGDYKSAFLIPKNAGTTTIFDSFLILGAIGPEGDIFMSASRNGNNQFGSYVSDFWPGPVCNPYSYTIGYDDQWNRVWKVSRSEIGDHILHHGDAGYTVPPVIAQWPVQGEPEMGQAPSLAKYVDANGNGMYEPELGDYPWIPGEESILSIYNDGRLGNLASKGEPLGVEVQQYAYAFDCPGDSAFQNAVFIHYKIINRSQNSLQELYAGIITEFRLGPEHDDYFGCDSTLSAYFVYNDSVDEVYYYTPAYGMHPPAQAVCFLNQPMKSFVRHDFVYKSYSMNGLKGLWPNGNTVYVGGYGQNGTTETKYLFSGDPSDPGQWSEIQSTPEAKGNKKGIGSVGPFQFEPGDTIQLDIAYVFARDYDGTNLSSVNLLKERIERIRWFYDNDSTPCGTLWSGETENESADRNPSVSPNPCADYLNIRFKNHRDNPTGSYTIYNINGIAVESGQLKYAENRLFTGRLPAGLYLIRVVIENEVMVTKLVKQ